MFTKFYAVALLSCLAWTPLAALAAFQSIVFSDVTQCGPFTVTFKGGEPPSALPLTLTVVPLNATPISIPIPLDAWNDSAKTGVMVTFLPFESGTEFIATLDDAEGNPAASTSDVLAIRPDRSGAVDTTCLPKDPAPFVPHYAVRTPLSQCKPFSVEYNATQHVVAPTVRSFRPRGASVVLNQTFADDAAGVATYVMVGKRDTQVLLVLGDPSTGYKESTFVLPISGDITSNISCLPLSGLPNYAMTDGGSKPPQLPSKTAFIVISVCGGVVFLVAVAMCLWFFRYRRRQRKFKRLDEGAFVEVTPSNDAEKGAMAGPRTTTPMFGVTRADPTFRFSRVSSTHGAPIQGAPMSVSTPGYVVNPAYTAQGLVTPTTPHRNPFGSASDDEGELSPPAMSEARVTRDRPEYDFTITPDNSFASKTLLRASGPPRSPSISSMEIEQILEMATVYGSPDVDPALGMPQRARLRQSAYMAGTESRMTSPVSPPPSKSRVGSPIYSPSKSSARTFREPPMAQLPSTPLASPHAARADSATFAELQRPPPARRRDTGASEYSDEDDGRRLSEYSVLRPPPSRPLVR